ncbi:MAG: PKD domain-containing protein [Thermoplasmatota archaeon]
MSRTARSKTMGIFLVLSLALAGILFLPAGASAEGMANLKVRVIEKDFLENIEFADVYCVNVHTGDMYDLFWDSKDSRYEADVPAGSYHVFASAEGYGMQEEPLVVPGITSEDDDTVQIIRLKYIPEDITLEFNVDAASDGEELENAKIHVFAGGSAHLMAATNQTGYAKIKAPEETTLHILIFYEGMKTFSTSGSWNTSQEWNVSLERPSSRVNSYKVIGFVKNGTRNVANLDVHVWDVDFGHMVPLEEGFEGALSLPLYMGNFHVLVEADGYEPLWLPDIDLTSETFYTPDNDEETFEMHKIGTKASMLTTIELNIDVANPVVTTVWTMDANSVFWGTENTFGTPRMQISGPFYSNDWLKAETQEANDTRDLLESFGPAYMTSDNLFQVNGEHFTADLDNYDVEIMGLSGDVLAMDVNPTITMTQPYTSEMEIEEDENIRVEIFTLMEDETIVVKLPDNYEILGDFDDDVAEHMDGNPSILKVYEPLEFNAKVKAKPTSALKFTNYYDFYEKDDKEYIVKLDTNVTLSAKDSEDLVGEIVEYQWNLPGSVKVWDDDQEKLVALGALNIKEMEMITIQFTQDGYHNVTLKVKDSAGDLSDADWIVLIPDSTKPTIDDYTMKIKSNLENVTYDPGTGNFSIDEDVEFYLNASTAGDGEHGVIGDYVWTFDDDSGSLNGEVVTKRFADPGFYNIQLKIVDTVENELLVQNKTIIVHDTTKPMAVIKPLPDVDQGDEVELNASQSYDPRTTGNLEDDIVAWTWYIRKDKENWTVQGDEDHPPIGTEKIIEYTFDKPGSFIINLTVEDKSGLKGWVEKIQFVSGPDLQIRGVTFRDPDENHMNEGERTKISIAYANEGTVDINGTWIIRMTDNGKKVKEEEISGILKSGEVSYLNFSYKLKSGERQFEVYLDFSKEDSNGTIPEMNEENNFFETTVKVEASEPFIQPWMIIVVILVIIAGYVAYMKFTRQEWGYEPIQRWWEKRNA